MNGIEDLVRETLAQRAHDVDGIALATTPPPRHTPQRWVAVGTVLAAAAAVVAAVVLVAPWSGTPHRPAPAASETPVVADPAPPPPAGMKAVSFHGITLTVPDEFAVGQFFCRAPEFDMVAVQGEIASSPEACPTWPGDRPATIPESVTGVTLSALDGSAHGNEITVGGHPAYRLDTTPSADPGSPLTVVVQLPDVGVQVSILVQSGDPAKVQAILDGITYTPVDANGCSAQLSGDAISADLPGGPVTVGPATGGIMCEYFAPRDASGDVTGTYLYGSRVLTADDLAQLRAVVDHTTPWTGSRGGNVGWSGPTLVFRLSDDDGTPRTLAFWADGNQHAMTDGAHRAAVVWDGSGSYSLPQIYIS